LHFSWLPQRQLSAAPAAKTRHTGYRRGVVLLDIYERLIFAGQLKLRGGLQFSYVNQNYEHMAVNRFLKQKNHPAVNRVIS